MQNVQLKESPRCAIAIARGRHSIVLGSTLFSATDALLLLPHSSKVVELPLLIHFDTLAQAAAASIAPTASATDLWLMLLLLNLMLTLLMLNLMLMTLLLIHLRTTDSTIN